MEISKPAGIDLGTTNSCIGAMDLTDTDVFLASDAMGTQTLPSCVWYDAKKNYVVIGKNAFIRRGSAPEPVTSIKRKMGTMLLTPLGKAGIIPDNIPNILKRVLSEDRTQRLERYLISKIHDPNPEREARLRAEQRKNPPELWVFDQAARLARYIDNIEDSTRREAITKDPPLLWLPQEISALILAEEGRQMLDNLSQKKGKSTPVVDRAVITVPAYFGAPQCEATKEAGALAGLQVMELLQEPSAASLYYCWKKNLEDGAFMVFDLGGGTFDVSIVRRLQGASDVIGISGDNFLGGDDMDALLANWIRKKVYSGDEAYDLELDLNKEEDRRIHSDFVLLAETCKKRLSTDSSFRLLATSIRDKQGQRVMIDMEITRTELDALINPLLTKCIPKCWEALARAKKDADTSLKDIDQIFLVGGSTHVPLVQELIRDHFCSIDGAEPLGQAKVAPILSEIEGDDAKETDELGALAQTMMLSGERAKCTQPLREEPELCVGLGAAIAAVTHGVRRGDIVFYGACCTKNMTTPIKGKVLGKQECLDGAVVRLQNEALNVREEVELTSKRTFVFKSVCLQQNTANRFEVEVVGTSGDIFACADIIISQGSTVDVTPPPPRLSKAYYIDIQSQGRVQRKALVNSGVTLPTEEKHTLSVPDPNTGMLYFKIYQGKRLIETIEAMIDPTLPAGTFIDFTFSISEDYLLLAQYRIGEGESQSVTILPPPKEEPPKPSQVAELNKRIEEDLGFKDLLNAQIFRLRKEKINVSIEHARAAGDDAKLIDEYGRLEDLRREILESSPQLDPPWEVYLGYQQKCLTLLRLIEEQRPDYPAGDTRKNISQQSVRAQAAFDAHDQRLYGEYFVRLKDIHEALKSVLGNVDERSKMPNEERALRHVRSLLKQSKELKEAASNFTSQFRVRVAKPPQGQTSKQNQSLAEECQRNKKDLLSCERQLEALREKWGQNPRKVLSECAAISGQIERSRTILLHAQNVLNRRVDIDIDIIKLPTNPTGEIG